MPELHSRDFDAFMREVTGFDPFPWQRRLLHRVLDEGWPELLDLPTGTGKTSALLVALFALALRPEGSYRRMALVVDRRIIVDQVDGFARQIHAALDDPSRPACAMVAERLRSLSSSASPLRVVHLRGGIPRDDSWVSAPDQPTIIASTVDQVGSRLLFRGYGVSPGMRPVHAGLLARDTLYFLDEVHLATAFEETLRSLEERYAEWPERAVGRGFRVVRMSATPPGTEAPTKRFGLDGDDRAHPVLAKRLEVARSADLEVVKTKRGNDPSVWAGNRAKVAAAACDRARQAAKEGARAIGVVVNRVDTARRAAATLSKGEGEVLLITGRMRPFERTAIYEHLERSAAAGATREADAPPTFVVATSCIEAGADLDFDALITEAASLDALRQRFGRLNRLGAHHKTWAWVLGRRDQLSTKAPPDPVYGDALRHTWTHLDSVAQTTGKRTSVDFGLSAFVDPNDPNLLPERAEAPVMFPSYLDMWSETRPAPFPDPDPALWLHGKGRKRERDVHVVFRADLPRVTDDEAAVARASEALEFLPPVSEEAVSVPLVELLGWLGDDSLAWRWSAAGLEVIRAKALEPGDTVLVAAQRGGLGLGTWDPRASLDVEDVADRAHFALRGVARLRLDARTLPPSLAEGVPKPPSSDDLDTLEAARRTCESWLDGLSARLTELTKDWRSLLQAVAAPRGKRTLSVGSSAEGQARWWVTVVPSGQAAVATTEDAISAFSGAEVTLEDHLRDVEAWAGHFSQQAGLTPILAEDVALAGLLHDLGKADIRFQAMLRGGDPIQAIAGQPLAKSRHFGSARARARARERSGWPGLRHELISLALLDASPELSARAHDLELVRHLVASHHGWCRPWAPTTLDPRPGTVRACVAGIEAVVSTAALDDAFLDGCAPRFRGLCRRYGWHGLAYLEALLRLGDHRASATPRARPQEDS